MCVQAAIHTTFTYNTHIHTAAIAGGTDLILHSTIRHTPRHIYNHMYIHKSRERASGGGSHGRSSNPIDRARHRQSPLVQHRALYTRARSRRRRAIPPARKSQAASQEQRDRRRRRRQHGVHSAQCVFNGVGLRACCLRARAIAQSLFKRVNA